MKATVNSVTGFADAFVAMYISKRSWTPELDKEIREVCYIIESSGGKLTPTPDNIELMDKFNKWLDMALRMGKKHITILRYITISIMTEGLHRAGQDDVDAHAKRFENKIIRSSTRLAKFEQDEFSDYYKDKVMTTDKMMNNLNIIMPDTVYETNDNVFCTCSNPRDKDLMNVKTVWVKSPNGYVKEEYRDNKDVLRGLYMLGIPSNFVSQISLTEWAHVFHERNKDGGANPEVKEWAEMVMEGITTKYPSITRDAVLAIEN